MLIKSVICVNLWLNSVINYLSPVDYEARYVKVQSMEYDKKIITIYFGLCLS